MAKSSVKVKVAGFDKALQTALDEYGYQVTRSVNEAGSRAMAELVRLTKATAPVGYRKKFRRSISSKERYTRRGKYTGSRTFTWFVKPPDHRLTHLLVHGHATKDGGRTKADPFLVNALEQVEKQYIEDVEEAVSNG